MEGLAGLPDRVAALELQISEFRTEVRVEFSAVLTKIRDCEDRLRGDMRELNQDTRTHMLVLHEEVISRIALLDEHKKSRQGPPRAPGRNPRHKKIKP